MYKCQDTFQFKTYYLKEKKLNINEKNFKK